MLRPYKGISDHHFRERNYVGLQKYQNADERSEHDAVKENVTQNIAFMAVPLVAVLAQHACADLPADAPAAVAGTSTAETPT